MGFRFGGIPPLKAKMKKKVNKRILQCPYGNDTCRKFCKEGTEIMLTGKVDEEGMHQAYILGENTYCWYDECWYNKR